MNRKRLVVGKILLPYIFVSIFLFCGFVNASVIVGNLSFVTGNVKMEKAVEKYYTKAAIGTIIHLNDKIKTGVNGKAELMLGDKSEIHIGEATRLRVSRYFLSAESKRDIDVNLIDGVIRAIVTAGRGRFEVTTRNSIAGVKGTDFMVKAKGNASFYFENRGVVYVRNDKAGVTITGGLVTENYHNRKLFKPISTKIDRYLAQALMIMKDSTSGKIPPSIEQNALLNEILARWNINYAHYLADSGRYYDAETAMNIANELSAKSSVRSEILMNMGSIYAIYFGKPGKALKYFSEIVNKYPKSISYETALYDMAMTLNEMGRDASANKYFKRYLKEFPKGRYRYGVTYYIKKYDRFH